MSTAPSAPSPEETTPDRVGGKASVLFALQRAGFRVPETYVSPADLPAVVEALGAPIAVRSSATVEDGSRTSFAGQFESYLNLRTLEEVEEAVRKVEASVEGEAVREYCRRNGIDPAEVEMKVIVQRMIEPVLAGVAFSLDPVSGADEVVVEAVPGVAEDLLAGKASALPADDPLLAAHRPAIAEAVRAVQRHFGAPQDVEFAVDADGGLVLLQARPITRIGFSADLGEWTNADFRDGGVSSTVCTPLMWSLYDTIWESSLKAFLREIKLLGRREEFTAGRMFYGRPYWNLSAVKRSLARLPGFNEREFDTDLSVEVRYDGDGVVTPVDLRTVLAAIPTALRVPGVFRRQRAFNEAFLAGGFEALEAKHDIPDPADPVQHLSDLIHMAYVPTETNYFRTIFVSHIAKILFDEAFPGVDTPALVSALPPMSHLAPTRALQELAAQGETDIGPLLRRFRHHSRRELDLRVPRWDEDPEHVRELLDAYAAAAAQRRPARDPGARYREVREATRAALPRRKRKPFDRKLDRLRTFLWQREEMRDRSVRIYYLIRRAVLQVAESRGLGDDAFFMTWHELLTDDRTAVAERRDVYERFRSFDAPNEVGARFAGAPAAAADPAAELRGIAASQGTVRATARVARSVEEALRIEAGAVLVCPFTDPGWTPVLDRVAGVVTETGGLLSHAAVICREYGIPAVLGVSAATQRIPDGAQVVLHGGEGRVELVG